MKARADIVYLSAIKIRNLIFQKSTALAYLQTKAEKI
jgi:hypothetical protein